MTLTAVANIVILVLATMRLSRFLVIDTLGRTLLDKSGILRVPLFRDLFGCLFCWGFWAGVFWLVLLYLAGGVNNASLWWVYGAGAFALNEVTAHIGLRLGDGGYTDE